MKVLLIAESRNGQLLPASYEPLAFAQKFALDAATFLVGSNADLPRISGPLYLAENAAVGDYNPEGHLALLLEAVKAVQPELIVFCHSAYGWDLAPRLALALQAAQISEVIDYRDGAFVVPACNGKLRRTVRATTATTIVTLQSGAFNIAGEPNGAPSVVALGAPASRRVELLGYEAAEKGGVDLSKAEVVVSAGRGIGKPENLPIVEALAKALGGELGASRPVVDAGWVPHSRQVGSTGQTVAPKLYVACGISGAIQHLAGMKKSGFIVAVNTDKEAPIGEVADVLVVADLKTFLPALTAKLPPRG
jgi:electron transfer flavoprotein alpha subunit